MNLSKRGERSFSNTESYQDHNETFSTSSDSPFARSVVETPPRGFSISRVGLNKTVPLPELPNLTQTTESSQTQTTSNPSSSNRTFKKRFLTKEITEKSHQIPYDENGVPMVRLGTCSEFVYPDGHFETITSPH
ncbi:hypothetical protein GPJ56_003082 [Histomonas meleagridis]|uniref:uncharacterized protein n=1 Tax=Histomonas meleagridis TaxID=135588 RepID=UPI00355A44F5|nr:hypothetical protein GPJ56_003082 [Histomonas meleagridis]KAH0805145.1 hypothetical protein GO595_002090 [Histomonas meleagridis]